MRWLAFVGEREIGEVEAPDQSVARARAWARWGAVVTRVVSAVELGIEQEEAEARARSRRWEEEEDGDD